MSHLYVLLLCMAQRWHLRGSRPCQSPGRWWPCAEVLWGAQRLAWCTAAPPASAAGAGTWEPTAACWDMAPRGYIEGTHKHVIHYVCYSPSMEKERRPETIELVWTVWAVERYHTTHVVQTRHLKLKTSISDYAFIFIMYKKQKCYFWILHIKHIFFINYNKLCTPLVQRKKKKKV